MVTGADEGPCEGESPGSIDLMRSDENRAKNASSAWLRECPALTCLRSNRAAGAHLLHLRDSLMHWEMVTGSLGQGAMSSETQVDQSFFSREVRAPVSIPGRLTSVSAPLPGVCPAPAELRHVLW